MKKIIFLAAFYAALLYLIDIDLFPHRSIANVLEQEHVAKIIPIKNHEESDLISIKSENLPLKIPAISHRIWLTSEKTPREINEDDLNHTINTIKSLNSGKLKWSHILWTNDQNLIPGTINKLKEFSIEIKNVNELENQVLLKDIQDMINKNSFSEASDLIRYLALEKYGGVYFDTDYELFRPIDNLMRTYSFMGVDNRKSHDESGFSEISSAFIAAKSNHLVIKEAVKLITRNLHNKNLPQYIKNAYTRRAKIWVKTGPIVLTAAFYLKNIENDDVIFNYRYFYRDCQKEKFSDQEQVYGCHVGDGNWFGDSSKKQNIIIRIYKELKSEFFLD
jgi:mannosyltransferase OCH1-like enzyme